MPSSPAPQLPLNARRAQTARRRFRDPRPGEQFEGYLAPDRPNAAAYDEMFDPDGSVRAPYPDYATHLLRALRAAAAPNVADPKVVVLTPGVANSAWWTSSTGGSTTSS